MMHPGVTLIGLVSNDIVRIAGQPDGHQPGGTVFYAGMALRALGVPVDILTRAALADAQALLAPLRQAGADVANLPTQETTRFINIYGPGTDERRQEASARADPFIPADAAGLSTQWVYFAPLLEGDIPARLILEIAGRGAHRIALDAQGMVRRAIDGKVIPCSWPGNHEVLPHIDILKADAEEAFLLTGQADPEMAARILCGRGVDHALVTLGEAGAVLCHRGALIRQAAFRPANGGWPVVDTTGCGDTFLAAYLAAIIGGETMPVAGRFAAVAAALKQTDYGPLRADAQHIRRLSET